MTAIGGQLVGEFPTRLIVSAMCGADVLMLEFEHPEGYEFAAGQWFQLTLQTAEGPQTRIFSHASTPGERRLLMATRLSGSSFKQALGSMQPGDEATIKGPGGRLGIPVESQRVVFLTGGVGVTPVRSLLLDAAESGRVFDDALVLYGSRTVDCAPYHSDLVALAPHGVRVVQVIEHPERDWVGERGFIDAEMVRRHIDDVERRLFVVTGPPPMVTAMEAVMDELGVPQASQMIERFTAPPARPVTPASAGVESDRSTVRIGRQSAGEDGAGFE